VYNKLKYALIILLFLGMSLGVAYAYQDSLNVFGNTEVQNFRFINQMMLESSRYTQPNTIDPIKLNDYLNKYTLSYTEEQLETLGFELMFESDELKVYFEKDSFSMMIENKETGYFWSSRAEYQGISGRQEDNQAARRLMNSGLWVEYVRAANVQSASVPMESLYTFADVQFQNDASITEENNDPLRPYYIQPGSYNTLRVSTTFKERHEDMFIVNVNIRVISVQFDVHISLKENQIEVFIPNESIVESGDIFKLLAIQIFPYFGSSREDLVPGYVLIPDGIGALVRTDRRHDAYFQARFYGNDLGYRTRTLPELSLPIYGFVHHENNNAFYVSVDEGAETSQLRAQFWGTSISTTRYNRITSRFAVRTIYRNIINRAGDGRDAIIDETTNQNYRVTFNILSNQDASYIGIAKDYQDQLVERGILSQREQTNNQNMPIHFSYIMSDREPAFIGTSKVEMTRANQVLESYEDFYEAGLTNQQTQLYGWSNDGFMHRSPYRVRISDSSDFERLVSKIQTDNNTIYLHNEYVISSELSSRVSFNRDVARNISRLKMTNENIQLNGRSIDMYYVTPERSLVMANADFNHYNDLGINGLSMPNFGNVLFSHYDGNYNERSDAVETYREIAQMYDQMILARPNLYLYDYISGYLDMPITNSQYDYYTDLVPLLPIVLKGYVSYYTPYLNFNALAEDRFLTMVDFAINPSYILTEEPTYKMRYTHANRFFTTERNLYRDEIIETYNYINGALKHVIGVTIDHREILDVGLVKVSYSNGVMIIINYTYDNQIVDGLNVNARDYRVVMP
jgi:hypothetical protein